MIFETHAHYDDRKFDEDRDSLLCSMKEHGIDKIVNIGCDRATCEATLKLVDQYDFVYGALGVHPSDIDTMDENLYAWIRQQLHHPKIVAVGEIGLDYYWDKEEEVQKTQREWFSRQLELAKEAGLPFVIHSRDAAADTFDLIKAHHTEASRGIIHCFSYSKEMAKEYVKMGYYIGVGGVVTFKNAKKLKEVVEAIPIEHIVLETDCPYMAPEPYRGKRNSSLYLPYVAEKIAQIKGITTEEVEKITYRNAQDLFGI